MKGDDWQFKKEDWKRIQANGGKRETWQDWWARMAKDSGAKKEGGTNQDNIVRYEFEVEGKVGYKTLDGRKTAHLDCTFETYEQVNISGVWTDGAGISIANKWKRMNTRWNKFPLRDEISDGKESSFTHDDWPAINVDNAITHGKRGKNGGITVYLQFFQRILNRNPECANVCSKTVVGFFAEYKLYIDKNDIPIVAKSGFSVLNGFGGYTQWPERMKWPGTNRTSEDK